MQLNLYIPKEREYLLEDLDRGARELGKNKNALVLDALEEYLLALRSSKPKPVFRTFKLGVQEPFRRADIYDERIAHVLGQDFDK